MRHTARLTYTKIQGIWKTPEVRNKLAQTNEWKHFSENKH